MILNKNGHSPQVSQCNSQLTALVFVRPKVISIITAQCKEMPQIPRGPYLFIIDEVGTLCSTMASCRSTGFEFIQVYNAGLALAAQTELSVWCTCVFMMTLLRPFLKHSAATPTATVPQDKASGADALEKTCLAHVLLMAGARGTGLA